MESKTVIQGLLVNSLAMTNAEKAENTAFIKWSISGCTLFRRLCLQNKISCMIKQAK